MRPARFTKHKYKAVRVEHDDIAFDSKAEGRRYQALKMLRTAGDVVQFLRQVPFYLPGGVKYVCDFQVFWANGSVTFEDVKGMQTESFKAKKRMVEAMYAPIKIEVVKA